MPSNTERGKAFQLVCCAALKQALGREFELEAEIDIGSGKRHKFDLATKERDIVAECKAFTFTATGNNPSAKITTLREAAMYLRMIPGKVERLLIVKHDRHPVRRETPAGYFVRLNAVHLYQIIVLEIAEPGGDLNCLHGHFAFGSLDLK